VQVEAVRVVARPVAQPLVAVLARAVAAAQRASLQLEAVRRQDRSARVPRLGKRQIRCEERRAARAAARGLGHLHAHDAAVLAEVLWAAQRGLAGDGGGQARHVHQVPLHHPHVHELGLGAGLARRQRVVLRPRRGRGARGVGCRSGARSPRRVVVRARTRGGASSSSRRGVSSRTDGQRHAAGGLRPPQHRHEVAVGASPQQAAARCSRCPDGNGLRPSLRRLQARCGSLGGCQPRFSAGSSARNGVQK